MVYLIPASAFIILYGIVIISLRRQNQTYEVSFHCNEINIMYKFLLFLNLS